MCGPASLVIARRAVARLAGLPARTWSGRKERGRRGLQQHLLRRHHGDHVPRANLGAKLTADTDGQIDGANPHRITRICGVGYLVDAIDGTHHYTRIAPRTQILIENR